MFRGADVGDRGTTLKEPTAAQPVPVPLAKARRAFVGQSFAPADREPNTVVARFLTASGIEVVTGERPSAGSVSSTRIEACDLFVGVFYPQTANWAEAGVDY